MITALLVLCQEEPSSRATASQIAAAAGVSRSTFYQHFGDRDDCFLATYRQIARGYRETVLAAARAAPAGQRVPAALNAFLGAIAKNEFAARLAIVDALGAGGPVRAERERLAAQSAALVAQLGTDPRRALQAPPAALAGGIGGIINLRLMGNQAIAAESLSVELLAWLRSFSLPPGAERWSPERWDALGEGQPTPSPKPSREVASPDPIIAATARLSRLRGFRAITVTDLTIAAGVSRRTFYGRYAGKEEAFLAAQEACLREVAARVAAAYFVPARWPERVWAGLDALLCYVSSEPDLSYLDVVESYAAGPTAIERSITNRNGFTLFLADGYSQSERARQLPALTSEALVAGVLEILRRELLRGRASNLRRLLPQLAHFTLAPYLGAAEAREFVTMKASHQTR